MIKLNLHANEGHILANTDFLILCSNKSKMETLIQQTQAFNLSYIQPTKSVSIFARFFSWCRSQEKYHFGWLAAIIAIHGCVLTPITVLAVMFSGNSMLLWSFAMGAMAMSLITNLAALSTKITIPVFFFSVLIDLVIIANCIAMAITVSASNI